MAVPQDAPPLCRNLGCRGNAVRIRRKKAADGSWYRGTVMTVPYAMADRGAIPTADEGGLWKKDSKIAAGRRKLDNLHEIILTVKENNGRLRLEIYSAKYQFSERGGAVKESKAD